MHPYTEVFACNDGACCCYSIDMSVCGFIVVDESRKKYTAETFKPTAVTYYSSRIKVPSVLVVMIELSELTGFHRPIKGKKSKLLRYINKRTFGC